MYGETYIVILPCLHVAGLSPHVRGNRAGAQGPRSGAGSIPACTGKPAANGGRGRSTMVYPRMYGETAAGGLAREPCLGLSPHVRGNLCRRPPWPPSLGSIPACTGKPLKAWLPRALPRVYPRMYGETTRRTGLPMPGGGLSPHVRGNPRCRNRISPLSRSIPACTGKPRRGIPDEYEEGVYPRMYGETIP